MATSRDEIFVKIVTDTQSAIASLANLAKSVVGISISFQTFKKVIVDSFKEYLESEKAEQRLAAAIRITGQQRTASLPGLLAYAKNLQQITGYQDEETESAMGLLMQLGNLSDQGVMKIIPHIQDFASAMGLDLVQAATLVGKTMGSTTNMLGRYGIQIRDGLDPNEKFVAIMDQLQKKFGGFAAELQATTTGGQIKEFSNQIKDLKENFGGLIANLMNPVLKDINRYFGIRDILKTPSSSFTDSNSVKLAIDTLSKERERLMVGVEQLYKGVEKNMLLGNIAELSGKIGELRSQLGKLNALPKNIVPNVIGDPNAMREANAFVEASMKNDYQTRLEMYKAYQAEMQIISEQVKNASWADVPTRGGGKTGSSKGPIADAKELASQMQTVADATKGFMEALATGDVSGFFQQLIQQAVSALVPMALLAAATAATHGDFVTMTVWLAVAGMTLAAGVGFSGAGAGGGNGSSSLPHYASGTDYVPQTGMAVVHQGERITPYGAGGGGMTVNVYGSVWAAKDLARELTSIQGQW